MSYMKIYAVSAIFVFLTIIKLLLPDASDQYINKIIELVELDYDYRNTAIQVATLVSEGNAFNGLGDVLGGSRIDSDDGVSDSLNEHDAGYCITMPDNDSSSDLLFHSDETQLPDDVSLSEPIVPFVYTSPVQGIQSSGFGYRQHPIFEEILFHYGTDYAVPEGTAVLAFADGTVSALGFEEGYGNYVELTHENGWKSLYAHCNKIHVDLYDDVNCGDEIALSGSSGRVTGPHLHFELVHDGLYINPEFFF